MKLVKIGQKRAGIFMDPEGLEEGCKATMSIWSFIFRRETDFTSMNPKYFYDAWKCITNASKSKTCSFTLTFMMQLYKRLPWDVTGLPSFCWEGQDLERQKWSFTEYFGTLENWCLLSSDGGFEVSSHVQVNNWVHIVTEWERLKLRLRLMLIY